MTTGIANTLFARTAQVLAAAAVAVFCGAAHADDTELFVTQSGLSDARTNVLFIIDTSGSMDTNVLTQAPFNASNTYSGCYDSNSIYFGTTPTLPDCGNANLIPKTRNFCQASKTSLAAVGQYGGFFLGWSVERQHWEELGEDLQNRPVECLADRGVNGGGNGGKLFASNGPTGPWDSSAANEPAWNSQYQMFDGNWLNWKSNPPTITRTRLQIVQDVVNSIVGNLRNVNVGIMRFNGDNGGSVIAPLENVDTAATRIKSAVDGLFPDGTTPLAETLYEAGQYLAGRAVDFGNFDPVRSVASARLGGSPAGALYNSPITAACQKNFIVLLTDGEPNNDSDADAKIAGLPDFAQTLGQAQCDGTGDGACLDDMAEYLFKHDINPNLPGIQNVVVSTIGFTVDAQILADTARRGGGQYFLADDTASLSAVLTELVRGVIERTASFSSPLVSVNVFNRTQTVDDAFISLFQPSGTAHWPGNLKKYRFLNGQLVGRNGLPAIDPDTGFFSNDAFSFWSPQPDGNRVKDGGAASQIPAPGTRQVYSNLVSGNLNASGNAFTTANAALTPALLGVPAAQKDALIDWARGRDVNDDNADGSNTDTRHAMGDPLHVGPVSVTYGGTATNPDSVIFVSTNDGYMHAVNSATGVELWSFIPKRLLPRLYELFLNGPTAVHRYGLDGPIRVFIRNDDGVAGISGSEQVILLFGMGRGGDAVFALDVTNRNAPILLWEIDSSSVGLGGLGQTWSTPSVARVNTGSDRLVAIFGGGYDDSQDTRGYHPDAVGNALYMVDLLTGALVWSAGLQNAGHDLELSAMQNSIPAPVTVLDVNGDGLADRMYVGDMGGRLWRFDINNGQAASGLVSGGVLATLGAADVTGTPASEARRFYTSPDAVLTTTGKRQFIGINIGSGYRGHPLDTDVEDSFFSVRDFNVFGSIPTDQYPSPVTADALIDITNLPGATLLPNDKGWRLRMVQNAGEKILSGSTTLLGATFFTSFTPTGPADACVAAGGINRLYIVNAVNGQPLLNLDGVGDDKQLTATDRSLELKQTGIAPMPAVLLPANDTPLLCVGAECRPLPGPDPTKLRRSFWLQDQG
jgi:type IV pilus assembly protein PilY1